MSSLSFERCFYNCHNAQSFHPAEEKQEEEVEEEAVDEDEQHKNIQILIWTRAETRHYSLMW